ncbi:MAG: glycoside hydrolase family 2 protein [Verrucomicrobia bacterium]|jgi:beta-galactosidase|nr:glycoside hydrolase family 2 protein [Verrucomicrobiota bacterium]MBT7699795.1 glycoside hydrolase family 2 protein [Verrucomicrobiota bacterium]
MTRQITRLRDGWKFTRTPDAVPLGLECDDSGWETVEVPHDWAIAGPFDREHDIVRKVAKGQADIEENVRYITGRSGGLPHIGEGWYRKELDIPASGAGRVFRLECDGIMSHSTVYCNGAPVGSWPYGYTSFAFDLSPFIQPGERNLIAVHVNNLGNSSRWYPGAGIYRNVRLVELDPVHIDLWGVEITTPEITNTHGTVNIVTRLAGIVETNGVSVRTTILTPQGEPVATDECAASGTAEQTLVVDAPELWSLESPTQYTVRSEVLLNGALTDVLDTRFGFRTLRFDVASGFYLNGISVKMKGVCQHHDLGPLGAAVNSAALRRQLEMLQEMGCNAIRTSHNPPTPELPAMASEMGILIIDEMFDEWKHLKMDNGYNILWDEWAEKDVRALIRRDRNHPAVIMWSIGNEIHEQSKEDGPAISQFLVDICHDEDPTRPVTAGLNHFGTPISHALAATLDIPGWNYKPHKYGHARLALPDKPIYGSETASTVSSRGEYYFPARDEIHERRDTLQVNSFDMSCPGWATSPDTEFQAQEAHPFVMGEFVWTGFDYLGEPTPYSEEWPSRSSYFGIIDLAGLPKDRYYLYQSHWTDKEVLHLLPHWTWPGLEGQPVSVQCYASYDKVELFVNGVSQGMRDRYEKGRVLQSNYRFLWQDVTYEPGEIKVVAYAGDGSILNETRRTTAGEPAAIELISDRESLQADGDDMAFITARIVDADGNLCPRAAHPLTFAIDGPARIVGLCNGDATSLESFKGNSMQAFNGLCVLYLRTLDGSAGHITVTAKADELMHGTVALQGGRGE